MTGSPLPPPSAVLGSGGAPQELSGGRGARPTPSPKLNSIFDVAKHHHELRTPGVGEPVIAQPEGCKAPARLCHSPCMGSPPPHVRSHSTHWRKHADALRRLFHITSHTTSCVVGEQLASKYPVATEQLVVSVTNREVRFGVCVERGWGWGWGQGVESRASTRWQTCARGSCMWE